MIQQTSNVGVCLMCLKMKYLCPKRETWVRTYAVHYINTQSNGMSNIVYSLFSIYIRQ